ncbi:single-stranded DNA-binding protein [Acidipropionibacterium jensenii]|uniref:Single-stranded DNA-binding protein n=1 Tax=Acidipropionibacterium jensenii TaxID=1749 RepID=A0A448NZ54_9ACTN|nr:single-stranded DNA-binding protein [Acidipropionibacterium jensenii]MDN5977516.1 single-stranded DNA-binding protein [Acidipropionibacterium jensenii]MDN5996475.1 single-stranded DNA-binding protein [Acidipropionibacterium jensenii]MDN6442102.1 single-stranded DNA-binding protein [Acidipropionibacterium jensenii]MDN6481027.1 single-stranded DNA-binding protein [Acidipropionibacterium jensenii]MDN6513905.1 single-stranded DNA-binding protein [Acidipropionibacterium jensenii]
MAGETSITVIGNLTADPELRFTPNGVPVANFTVASTPRTFDRQSNEWRDGEALFLNCSVWRNYAENVAESLSKGMRVVVQGNLKARSYEDRDGNRRTVHELDVQEVGPSLRYASAKVTRNPSGSGQGGQGGGWSGGGSGNQGGGSGNQGGNSGGWGQQPQGGNSGGWDNSQSGNQPGRQSGAPSGNQGNQGSYNQGADNRGGGVDPWAQAQSDEPPF